jgi:3-oxoacyl-[acyl-carrier-protein] synthase-3
MTTFVDSFTFALPEHHESVFDCAQRGATIYDAQLLQDAGFERHHFCNGTDAYSLAHQAVSKLEEQLDGVGAIVYSTCLPLNGNAGNCSEFDRTGDVKYLMDFPASRLQSAFQLDY